MSYVAALLLLLALIGIGYMLHASRAVAQFARRARPALVASEPVTLLKPLHGPEPRLAENLRTFLDQDWPAPIQLVAGVQRPDDPAIEVVEKLSSPVQAGAQVDGRGWAPPCAGEERGVDLILDSTAHGANAKVANLINMAPAARHDLLVLSDSDMAVPRDYLATIAAALAPPGIGAVTCLYRGRGDAGRWSVLAAGSISYAFLPAVLVGLSLKMAQPCMGSTIALRRETLDRIGGFDAFADRLADDYAVGEAVRALGLSIAIPPIVLDHAFTERRFAELWRHELRWAATTRAIVPASYVGTIVMHPFAFALLALPFAPLPAAAMAAASLAARLLLMRRVDRLTRARSMPVWMLPGRDILSFVVFLASFCVGHVDWRGAKLRMTGKGRVSAVPESPRS